MKVYEVMSVFILTCNLVEKTYPFGSKMVIRKSKLISKGAIVLR